MGQGSSSPNDHDQDGDIIMASDSDSETNVEDLSASEYPYEHSGPSRRLRNHINNDSFQTNGQSLSTPQGGSQRVLRMTPARRRRQLSNLYPFYPPATSINQSQVPFRPRSQRLHNSVVDDTSSQRQIDAIPTTTTRRGHTRSSVHNGREATQSASNGNNILHHQSSLPSIPIAEFCRPRSSSLDCDPPISERITHSERVMLDQRDRRHSHQELSRSSVLRETHHHYLSPDFIDFSSNGSSSSTSTQTDTLGTTNPQRHRRQRVMHRMLNLASARSEDTEGNTINNNSNNNNNNNNSNNNSNNDNNDTEEPNDSETQLLSRLLSLAAAATAASLVASQENAVIEAERAANEGQDGSFESFLAALQRRRRETATRPPTQSPPTSAQTISNESNPPTETGTAGSQSSPMSFFRLFRFGGSRPPSPQPSSSTSTTENTTAVPDPIQVAETGGNSSVSNALPQMVPVIIIGIRSVSPTNGNTPVDVTNIPANYDPINTSTSSRTTRSRSSSTSDRSSSRSHIRSTSSTGTQTPPARSWIIYVLGATWPSTHPLLSAPSSLFSENPSYEDMIMLSQLIGPARPPTTTQTEIEAMFPILKYDESIPGVNGYELLGNAEKCQVCLCNYSTDEELRVLNCRHGFHRECIDKWLTEGSNKCPICRGVAVASNNNREEAIHATHSLGSLPPF